MQVTSEEVETVRSSSEVHLTKEQYICFSKITKHFKYAGKSFVEDSRYACPSWQQLIKNTNSPTYFVWPTISGWLGSLKLGLLKVKCPDACQLYSDIHEAYEHCQSMRDAHQKCRSQRRHDNIRVKCFVYFISLGKGLFQVSLNPPAGKKSSDLNLCHAWHRWSVTAKELNTVAIKRDGIFKSKVRKLAVEAGQVNRIGQIWATRLPNVDHLLQSIPCHCKGTSLKKELPLGFEEEIQRAASSYLCTAQKMSNIKFYNEIRLSLGKKLQVVARKKIHKHICKLKNLK